MTVGELLDLDIPEPESLIEKVVPRRGASLIVGAKKAGKTILATQMAIATATGNELFEQYKVLFPGPALIVEHDDPSGDATIQTILKRSKAPRNAPIYFHRAVPFPFGAALNNWLADEIQKYGLRLVLLDSYTALRPSRPNGIDIVRAEHAEMTQLDQLGKHLNALIAVLHHESKTSANLDWSSRGAGTFALTMATESQLSISRFPDLGIDAPERLVRVMGRHLRPGEFVLRFQEDTLDYDHVLEGSAASLYPVLLQISETFKTQVFTPKEFCQATGIGRTTAFKFLGVLSRYGALTRVGHGEYRLATTL